MSDSFTGCLPSPTGGRCFRDTAIQLSNIESKRSGYPRASNIPGVTAPKKRDQGLLALLSMFRERERRSRSAKSFVPSDPVRPISVDNPQIRRPGTTQHAMSDRAAYCGRRVRRVMLWSYVSNCESRGLSEPGAVATDFFISQNYFTPFKRRSRSLPFPVLTLAARWIISTGKKSLSRLF